jgi:phenylacetaldehyde dehydrogenase
MIPLLPKVAAFLARPQGARIGAASVMTDDLLNLRNPSDETALADVAACAAPEADLAVRAAARAFDEVWRDMLPDDRSRRLWRLAEVIDAHAASWASWTRSTTANRLPRPATWTWHGRPGTFAISRAGPTRSKGR